MARQKKRSISEVTESIPKITLAKNASSGVIYCTATGLRIKVHKTHDDDGDPILNPIAEVEGEDPGPISAESELYPCDDQKTPFVSKKTARLKQLKERKKAAKTQEKEDLAEVNDGVHKSPAAAVRNVWPTLKGEHSENFAEMMKQLKALFPKRPERKLKRILKKQLQKMSEGS